MSTIAPLIGQALHLHGGVRERLLVLAPRGKDVHALAWRFTAERPWLPVQVTEGLDGRTMAVTPDRRLCEPIKQVWTLTQGDRDRFERVLTDSTDALDTPGALDRIYADAADDLSRLAARPVRLTRDPDDVHLARLTPQPTRAPQPRPRTRPADVWI